MNNQENCSSVESECIIADQFAMHGGKHKITKKNNKFKIIETINYQTTCREQNRRAFQVSFLKGSCAIFSQENGTTPPPPKKIRLNCNDGVILNWIDVGFENRVAVGSGDTASSSSPQVDLRDNEEEASGGARSRRPRGGVTWTRMIHTDRAATTMESGGDS